MNAFSITRKQVILLIILLILIFTLPLAIFLVQKRQEIRPRALGGKANFILQSDNQNPNAGEKFNVQVFLQLTEASLWVTGVDITLLYDKKKLSVESLVPSASKDSQDAPFTDVIIKKYGENFDDNFDYIRLSQVANKKTDDLAGGTVPLVSITFNTILSGRAEIKFPEDDSYLEVVGISTDTNGEPTVIPPTITTESDRQPTSTPTPTSSFSVVLNSASEKSCQVVCRENGFTSCFSIGIDAEATNGIYKKGVVTSSFNYTCVDESNESCLTSMSDEKVDCDGYKANWTNCRCSSAGEGR